MAIERTYYCDNPSCAADHPGDSETPLHACTATPPPYLPRGFIEVREGGPSVPELYFCGWDCLMKYAAKFPPAEIIPFDGFGDAGVE